VYVLERWLVPGKAVMATVTTDYLYMVSGTRASVQALIAGLTIER
jgi:hypothetical protein